MARILVVDDEEPIREMVRDMLEPEGHEVLEAENGREAIALYRIASADLVITNIVMPEKEGLETIRELRAEFPTVRIVAMSGGGEFGNVSYLDLALTFGALRALYKPFERRHLLEAVDTALAA